MRRLRTAVTIAFLISVLPGFVLSTGWSAPLQPLVVGWERIFKLDWQVAERRGHPSVRGYVVNNSPYSIHSVRLLVDALDASGTIIGQKVGYPTSSAMEPFSKSFFDIAAPGSGAASYQVRVFAFDRIESDSNKR
jgi:hypothetical protein